MFTIPLIAFLVVCGIGETILTFSWQAVFKKVDFPALGRPMIATTAVFNPADHAENADLRGFFYIQKEWQR